MATTKPADVLLRYRVDQASVNAVRASFDAVQARIDNVRADLAGVGTSAQRGVSGLRTQFRTASGDVNRLQDDLEQLRRAAQAVGDVDATPRTGGVGRLEAVDRIGTIGSQIAGGFGAGELGNVVGLVGDAANSLIALGPAGGAAALGVGAVSLALSKFTADAEATSKRLAALLEGEARAEELVATGTLDEQRARRAEVIQSIALAEAQQNERELERLQLLNAIGPRRAAEALALAELNVILGEDAAAVEAYNNAIEAQQEKVTGLNAEFVELNARIGEQEASIRGFRDGLAAIGGVFEPLVARVQGVAGGVTGLFNAARAVEPVIRNLSDGLARMREEARAAADQLRAEKADSYLNAVTQTVTAQEQLAKAQAAYNEAVTASQARISEISDRLQADLSEAETERQRDLADAAREAGEERVRAEEQRNAEIARIQRRFDRAYADAVGDRDALAAKRAEQQRDDELTQLDDRYKDQLKAADDGLKAQQRLIEQRYSQQVQTVRAGAEAALRLESQRAQQEINLRQQAVQAATVQLVNALNAETMIRATYYNQSISQAQSWAALMQLYTSYGLQVPTGGVQVVGTNTPYFTGNSTTNPYIGYQGGRADGGPMYPGGVYKVGERGPEYVTPLYPSMVHPSGSGAGGMTINVAGATTDTIRVVSRAQALATFGRVLDQLGVA